MFATLASVSRSFAAVAMTVAILAIAGCGDDHAGHDHGDHGAAAGDHGAAAAAAADYPLDTCVVSGEKLGSMGDPVVVQHDGVEVKLCCQGCVKTFNKDPEKYVAKVKAAAAQAADKE